MDAKRTHLTRLLKIWRSDGWPSRDALEIELLAAGWVRVVDEAGHEKLRLTEAGLALLAASRQRNQRALSAHDRLAERVAWQLHEAGRVVWRELSLRAKVGPESLATPPTQALDLFAPEPQPGALLAAEPAPAALAPFEPTASGWRMARPDVFSVRNTSVEAYLHPVVHEIKVSRADLFSDLRHAAKRASYQWLCCECHYVFPAGMAEPEELPEALGVWVMHGDIDTGRLEQLRPARHAPCTLPFAAWLALAKASPWQPERDPRQSHLGQPDGPMPGDAEAASLWSGSAAAAPAPASVPASARESASVSVPDAATASGAGKAAGLAAQAASSRASAQVLGFMPGRAAVLPPGHAAA